MSKKMEIREFNCPFCTKKHSVELPKREWKKYFMGELASVALKSATPTQREQVISHICPECQEKVFKI